MVASRGAVTGGGRDEEVEGGRTRGVVRRWIWEVRNVCFWVGRVEDDIIVRLGRVGLSRGVPGGWWCGWSGW